MLNKLPLNHEPINIDDAIGIERNAFDDTIRKLIKTITNNELHSVTEIIEHVEQGIEKSPELLRVVSYVFVGSLMQQIDMCYPDPEIA